MSPVWNGPVMTLDLVNRATKNEFKTLDEAKNWYLGATPHEHDRVCSAINDRVLDIDDYGNAVWFTRKRLELSRIHIKGVSHATAS